MSTPRDAIRRGIALIPEDRRQEAAFDDLSVLFNGTVASIRSFCRRGRIARGLERSETHRLLERFGVRCQSQRQAFHTLSGGNQQKVVVARWLRRDPGLLLLDEPTQGVDVAARAEIHRSIRTAVDAGAAAIVVTSDFEELALISDRVIVLRDGVVAAELAQGEFDAHTLVELAYGSHPEGCHEPD
jgi:ribose transport system ATP-binding protein